MLPYKKLKPYDKERMIMKCVTKKRIVVAEALNSKSLLDNDNIQTNIHLIPDTVHERDNIDIFRVEKFFAGRCMAPASRDTTEERKCLALQGV